jgi:hypothetical protein
MNIIEVQKQGAWEELRNLIWRKIHTCQMTCLSQKITAFSLKYKQGNKSADKQ